MKAENQRDRDELKAENQRDRDELKVENQRVLTELKDEMKSKEHAHAETLNHILAKIDAKK